MRSPPILTTLKYYLFTLFRSVILLFIYLLVTLHARSCRPNFATGGSVMAQWFQGAQNTDVTHPLAHVPHMSTGFGAEGGGDPGAFRSTDQRPSRLRSYCTHGVTDDNGTD